MAVSGYITVTFRSFKDRETGLYEARCPELDVSTTADELDDAFEGIAEATILYLTTLEEVGERARIFAERGIVTESEDPPLGERPVCARPDCIVD